MVSLELGLDVFVVVGLELAEKKFELQFKNPREPVFGPLSSSGP